MILIAGVLLLEVAGRAGERAARAGAGHEVGDATSRLLPDLRAGGLGVRQRVVRVRVLVRPERVALAGEPLGDLVVARRIVGRHRHRAHDDLGAVGLQQRHLLGRHLVGHDEHAAVPALGGHDGEADARVAAGGFDDRAARLQQTVALGGEDHLERRTVLRRAARVGGLHLHRQHSRQRLRAPSCASCARAACGRSGRSPSQRSAFHRDGHQPWVERNPRSGRAVPRRSTCRRDASDCPSALPSHPARRRSARHRCLGERRIACPP